MPTDNRRESQTVTIELDPAFGAGLTQGYGERMQWVNEIGVSEQPIFTAEIPLKPIDWLPSEPAETRGPRPSSPVSLELTVCGDVQIHGVSVDPYTRTALTVGGEIGTSVDALSRSILIIDEAADAVWNTLRSSVSDEMEASAPYGNLSSLLHNEPVLNTTQAAEVLTTNIERHEREHVRCLIDPETALWHELELFWRSVLLGANSRTWYDEEFLTRFVTLFTTPSRFTVEALAMATEEYTMADPALQQLLEASVAAQRGAEEELMRCFDRHGIDSETLSELLRTPVGETFCDLWVAYIVDTLRSGVPPKTIDPAGFRERVSGGAAPEMIALPAESRREFLDFVYDRCFGPVFEVVRLRSSETGYVLERTWHSMNPTVSNDDSLLAVRRALFRRQFLSRFSTNGGLAEQLAARTEAVERVIQGASLDEVSLFDQPGPDTTQLSGHLTDAETAACQALLGPQATTEELRRWLNDPTYALNDSRRHH